MAKRNISSFIRSLLLIVLTVLLGLLIRTYICEFRFVSGISMEPALHSGEMLCIDKTVDEYKRMDIVVIRYRDTTITKRIVGCPGDVPQIKKGTIYINNVPLSDPLYTNVDFAGIASSPITLEANEYFVLGDNVSQSYDSRYSDVGVVNQQDIIGKVAFAIFPFEKS